MATSQHWLPSLEKFGINLGLDRITYLLEKLGNPHRKFKSIHVAGTNGKGSTCAMIASILKEAGYKVGLYTSPHLFDYRERIQVNGKKIPPKQFEEGLSLIRKIAENPRLKSGELYPTIHCGVSGSQNSNQPTVFEVLTTLAFWYFAKKKVDYAVVEVGLGGRLDATNVIQPLVSVITNIDYEHTAILGKTLAKITREKAGIIKPGVPVITAETKREPLEVLKKIAKKNNTIFLEAGNWAKGKEAGLPAGRQGLEVGSRLLGRHQKSNTACAIAAIRLAGVKVPKKAIVDGLKKLKWPGRFQIISKKPLMIVDGAHNPAGAQTLQAAIKEIYPHQRFTIILGTQPDKDYKKMIKTLIPIAKKIIVTRSSHPQALNPQKIALFLKNQGTPHEVCRSIDKSLKCTLGDERVLITGSLFLVADALRTLT